ncbi:Uncharacterised protein [Paenibacillus thiaminolyticus]|nr:Uncharacterised protein [Paenibacillus thiaminolyticus]
MRDPREHSYHLILDAIAKMQWNAAMILEAKAMEAEKTRNWMLNHLTEIALPSMRKAPSKELKRISGCCRTTSWSYAA